MVNQPINPANKPFLYDFFTLYASLVKDKTLVKSTGTKPIVSEYFEGINLAISVPNVTEPSYPKVSCGHTCFLTIQVLVSFAFTKTVGGN